MFVCACHGDKYVQTRSVASKASPKVGSAPTGKTVHHRIAARAREVTQRRGRPALPARTCRQPHGVVGTHAFITVLISRNSWANGQSPSPAQNPNYACGVENAIGRRTPPSVAARPCRLRVQGASRPETAPFLGFLSRVTFAWLRSVSTLHRIRSPMLLNFSRLFRLVFFAFFAPLGPFRGHPLRVPSPSSAPFG